MLKTFLFTILLSFFVQEMLETQHYSNKNKYFSYQSSFIFSFGTNFKAAELIQYLIHPSSSGPSLNTCPRCASLFFDFTSVRGIASFVSFSSPMKLSSIGREKLGQPVPESNLSVDEKSAVPSITST
jgi:hypothetical protein